MMASFTDKPKIPLLGNSGSETFASLGTKKGSFESAYGTKFASRRVSEMPFAFDSEKDATSDKTHIGKSVLQTKIFGSQKCLSARWARFRSMDRQATLSHWLTFARCKGSICTRPIGSSLEIVSVV